MKQELFEQLKRELCACRLCEGKFDHEPRAIFQGAQDAKIMQISQAPSIHVPVSYTHLDVYKRQGIYDPLPDIGIVYRKGTALDIQ